MTMKWTAFSALAALLVITVSAGAADERNLADTIIGSREHTIFAVAVREAGFANLLRGPGPLTVFAPTDAAFDKMGDDTIKQLVKDKAWLRVLIEAHLIRNRLIFSKELTTLDGKEVNGFPIAAHKEGITIGAAKIIRPDITCSNGILHVVDTVLVPSQHAGK